MIEFLKKDKGVAISLAILLLFTLLGIDWVTTHSYFVAIYAMIELKSSEESIASFAKSKGLKDMYRWRTANDIKVVAMASMSVCMLTQCGSVMVGAATAIMVFATAASCIANYLRDKPDIAVYASSKHSNGRGYA